MSLYVDVHGPDVSRVELEAANVQYRQREARHDRRRISVHQIPFAEWRDLPGEPEHSNGAGWTKTATVADVEFTWFLARRDRHMPSARSLARLEQGVC